MDGRIIRHESVAAARDAAEQEVKSAMVAAPQAVRAVEQDDDHRPQWCAVRRALPDIVASLFIALMKTSVANATGEDPRVHKGTVVDLREQISKVVRSWRRRSKALLEIKKRYNTGIVGSEDRRREILARIERLNARSPFSMSAKDHAAEVVHQRACERLREHRKQHLTQLATAHADELRVFSGRTFGLGVACLRFFMVLRRQLDVVAKEYADMLRAIRNEAEVNNPERAAKCANLKQSFYHTVYEPTLTLLQHHGYSPDELRVAMAVYTDVEDADPFCVQRCGMIESTLSRLMKLPERERDEQAIALAEARRKVEELRHTAARLQNETAEALAGGHISSLRAIQAREAEVYSLLAQAERDVEQLSHYVTQAPEEPSEGADVLMKRVAAVHKACQRIKSAVEGAARVPDVVDRMAEDQRFVSSRKLLDAAVANVKAAKAEVVRDFDAADRRFAEQIGKANCIAEDMAVVETARASYEPTTYGQDEVAIYALRVELASVEAALHTLHVKRITTLSMFNAAKWIVDEGTRLLGKSIPK